MGIGGLARITDLFVEGKELVLREASKLPDGSTEPAVLVWVNKLNSFEAEEARRDGAVARARLILALRMEGSPERVLYEASVDDADLDSLREGLLEQSEAKWFREALNSMRVDEAWAEGYAVIQGTTDTDTLSEPEAEVMVKLQTDYINELNARVANLREAESMDLAGLDADKLRDKHREAWLDSQSVGAFSREIQRSQVYFAMRLCKAERDPDNDGWDHRNCTHERACESRADVARLPDGLLTGIAVMLQRLSIPNDDARFSAGAASSSAPSQRPSEAEASEQSSQGVSSDEPAKS